MQRPYFVRVSFAPVTRAERPFSVHQETFAKKCGNEKDTPKAAIAWPQ